MRRGDRFNTLKVGDVVHPRKQPTNRHIVIAVEKYGSGIRLQSVDGKRITERTMAQMHKNWRKL